MAIGDIFRVALIGEAQFGQELVNVFHYKQVGPLVLDTPAEDLMQALNEAMILEHQDTRSVATALNMVSIRSVTTPVTGADFPLVTPASGTITGEALPPQNACVVTWKTGNFGRSYRGRTYLWPAGESSQNSGVISDTYKALCDTWAGDSILIGNPVTTAQWQMVVWSETLNLGTDVTAFQTRTILHTQRRRVLGTGS